MRRITTIVLALLLFCVPATAQYFCCYYPATIGPIGPGSPGFLSNTTAAFSVQNYLLQSNSFTTSPWAVAGITAAAPTVTANNQVAPDSTTTASTVAYPAIPAGQSSIMYQPLANTVYNSFAFPFYATVWMRGAVGGETIYLSYANASGVAQAKAAIILTTTWTQYSVNWVVTSGATTLEIGIDGRDSSQRPGVGTQTVYVWHAMVGQSANATVFNYVPTTTAAAFATQNLPLPAGVAFRDFSGMTLINNPLIAQNTQPPADTNAVTTPIFTPTAKIGSTYYSLGAGDTSGWLFKNALLYTWTDVTHPTKYAGNPVLTATASAWDDHYLLHETIFKPQGSAVWWMYYSGVNAGGHSSIGRASSTDLVTWTKDVSNPILTGNTFAANLSDPSLPKIVQVGSQWIMYTSNANNNGVFGLYWTSPLNDGLNWTFGGISLNTPFGSDWDTGTTGMVDWFVFRNLHGFYEMAYTSLSGTHQQVGYAVSADGIIWYKYSGAPILTFSSPQAPFNGDTGDPFFYENGVTFYMGYDYSNTPTNTFASVNLLSMGDH